MQQINKVIEPFRDILALSYFGERWACPDMPDQTQYILHDSTKAFMNI